MTNEEFATKLQTVLITISEIWNEPQWEELNERLQREQFNYADLSIAQETFSHAERMLNPTAELEHIVHRIERWKAERN